MYARCNAETELISVFLSSFFHTECLNCTSFNDMNARINAIESKVKKVFWVLCVTEWVSKRLYFTDVFVVPDQTVRRGTPVSADDQQSTRGLDGQRGGRGQAHSPRPAVTRCLHVTKTSFLTLSVWRFSNQELIKGVVGNFIHPTIYWSVKNTLSLLTDSESNPKVQHTPHSHLRPTTQLCSFVACWTSIRPPTETRLDGW